MAVHSGLGGIFQTMNAFINRHSMSQSYKHRHRIKDRKSAVDLDLVLISRKITLNLMRQASRESTVLGSVFDRGSIPGGALQQLVVYGG
jgi:hypothetical protein